MPQRADLARRFEAVQNRHLNIHQYRVIRLLLHLLDRFLPIHRHIHLDPLAPQQFGGEFAVDLIIFDQQHPRARQVATGRRLRRTGGRLGLGPQNPATPQHRHNRVEQGGRRHRFDQKTINPRLFGPADHVFTAIGGHHDHLGLPGNGRIAVNTLGHLIAVHPRHPPIHQHQVVGLFSSSGQRRQGVRPVQRHADIEMEEAQHLGQDFAGHLVVIHHQHPHPFEQRAGLLHQIAPARLRLLGDLQMHGEPDGRALPGLRVLDPDPAPHPLDQILADRQPQARAAEPAGGGLIGLDEFFKQPGLNLRRHADARIAHIHLQGQRRFRGVDALQRQFDLAVLGELHRVAAQIEQNLPQAQGIADQHRRDGDIIANEEFEALLIGLGVDRIGQRLQHAVQPEFDLLDLQLARLDLGQIENVVDQAQQQIRRALRLRQLVMQIGRQFMFERQIQHADDRIHRRANFVAHVGQEFRLHARGGFGLRFGVHQFGGALIHQPLQIGALILQFLGRLHQRLSPLGDLPAQ